MGEAVFWGVSGDPTFLVGPNKVRSSTNASHTCLIHTTTPILGHNLDKGKHEKSLEPSNLFCIHFLTIGSICGKKVCCQRLIYNISKPKTIMTNYKSNSCLYGVPFLKCPKNVIKIWPDCFENKKFLYSMPISKKL